MQQNVGIRMPLKTEAVLQLDPADDQPMARHEPVDVVAVPDPETKYASHVGLSDLSERAFMLR
jgi:hypothetical protein